MRTGHRITMMLIRGWIKQNVWQLLGAMIALALASGYVMDQPVQTEFIQANIEAYSVAPEKGALSNRWARIELQNGRQTNAMIRFAVRHYQKGETVKVLRMVYRFTGERFEIVE